MDESTYERYATASEGSLLNSSDWKKRSRRFQLIEAGTQHHCGFKDRVLRVPRTACRGAGNTNAMARRERFEQSQAPRRKRPMNGLRRFQKLSVSSGPKVLVEDAR